MADDVGGHWYNRNSDPQFYQAGGRRTSLRDARKQHLIPSVTTYQSILPKPALDKWGRDQVAKSAFANPPIDGEDEDSYAKRMGNLAYRQTREAAEFGTAFHKAAEDLFDGKPMDEKFREYLEPVMEWKERKKITFLEREVTLANTTFGFAGTVDLICENSQGTKIIADYKTRKSHPSYPMRPYGPEIVQISAYAVLRFGPKAVEDEEIYGANLFVSSTEPGRFETCGYEPPELAKGWSLFKAIMATWRGLKNYDPRDDAA